ncbi:midasin [Odontomachus brunneus]|uniref:midasin n=1 Tax=Odontomachus brunneus TaxID=486640 RepID=UPI0013F1F3BC|nr:midasin [Odontomachus brunneus]
MLTKNLLTFCKRNIKYEQRFAELTPLKDFLAGCEPEPDRILETLCEFLMNTESTEDVADCFPELLPALVCMTISTDNIQSSTLFYKDVTHKLNAVILGKLIVINQDLLTFVLHYFDINPAPFESLDTSTATITPAKRQNTKKLSYYISEVSDYDIVTATYNILQSAVNHFKHRWNWSKFYKYLTNSDDKVKWVAFKCIAIVLNMSESTRLSYAQTFILNSEKFLTDHEDKRADTRISCASFESVEHTVKNITSVVSVGGILLPTRQSSNWKTCYDLVQVPSTRNNLQSLAIAIGSRKCICLQGPVGCGKTALVEYLARMTGHDALNFVKVQLGDQTDSKMLLGMYRCTDVPGEFVWQPGVLTQAVVAGKWLLLEDIDSAPLDVASVLSNLMETGTLCVPGYRDTIYANSDFQLFVTQRSTATTALKHVTGSSNLLQKHWLCLNVEPLSKEELVIVVKTLFPALNTAATKIIDVFLLFSVGDHNSEGNDGTLSLKTGRQTSTRDLIKWCSRAIVDYNVSSSNSALKILQDAIDVFCCSVTDQEQRLNLAKAITDKLGIIRTKAEYFCNIHKPAVTLLSNVLIAGRAKLRKKVRYVELQTDRTNFSFTRPSACLLQRIASCVVQKEPVLLVGETGTGKTSTIQYLAKSTGHKLTVINMNQQSESTDLLGGYKPVEIKFLISPIRQEYDILFRSYFDVELNEKFLEKIDLFYKNQTWKALLQVMRHTARAAVKKLRERCGEASQASEEDASKHSNANGDVQEKRAVHQDSRFNVDMWRNWENLLERLNKLYTQVRSQYALTFSFVESSLVKALRDGSWVLLDEINLANAETLECLSGLLESSSESLPLLERGDSEPVKRHPDFMVFACMNPATDIGKRDLPVGLRNRFTEFYVDELTEQIDLQLLVNSYLKEIEMKKHEAIVKFYLNVRKEAMSTLFDGTAHQPHYSLRTLCRALSISASNPCGNIVRSLFEAFSLSFLTQLEYKSYPIVQKMIATTILGNNQDIKAILGTAIPKPKCGPAEKYVNIEGYWVLQGSLTPETPNNYILTDSVRRNLRDLVRVVSIGKLPVLLQGDTSVGKTSLITYLAKISGHVCVRINNHEHTDLQEYVGSYVADETGKLVFKEGILVDAMRKGYWIILDELNLAPSDVLEALNRVLDDNRELFISETQQVVKAHQHFMLFATQNPPGIYGGRKVLSRAFRNRFVELHFDEIPANELQIILGKRCSMPESYCKEVISVMTDLQIRRKSTAAFAGKKGFITLRDLFRWGERYRLASIVDNTLYDWRQHLAEEGYLVLAAKVRKTEEADEIRQVIKKHLKREVDPNKLFTLNDNTSPVTKRILEEILNNEIPGFGHIVWTYHMRRMAVLVKKSCQFKEPVLLVGETGGGKTTICQVIAAINGQTMRGVNCHMHTESSDFLGNLRPVREHAENDKRLFEWVDGPLINAMRNGDLFLADEISLADDSVLERLNSLLEPERSLLLAEKGIESSHGEENTVIVADEKFVFIGTMNPGGDYGKKELSPALRNRFTEVWCEGCAVRNDLHNIIVHNLRVELQTLKESVSNAILRFTEWLHNTEVGKKLTVSVRDMLTWVNFINTCTVDVSSSLLTIGDAYYHGACLTYIDSLGSGTTGAESIEKLKSFADAATRFIRSELEHTIKSDLDTETLTVKKNTMLTDSSNVFGIPPFYIEKGPHACRDDRAFTFSTPTTKLNTLKLLRALQLSKPILLEGSPGVGKTSLVSALAKAAGHTLLRINLSDQTDVSDLFGADLPVEGGKGGEFAWRDGPFLRALRAGYWILLDELNLASQSVLEGLNACFDHRGEIYIPELGKTFSVKPGTRLFGCQNPLQQGGARRGLPKSFLNRFTQISVDALMEDDLRFILGVKFPQLATSLINDMVRFNSILASEVGVTWGCAGSPWEMNLRDITRWCEATIEATRNELRGDKEYFNPGHSVELIYVDRMRTKEDRQKVYHIYQEIFSLEKYPLPPNKLPMYITADKLFVGDVTLSQRDCCAHEEDNLLLLRDQKTALKSLMQCVKMNWMSILVGASGCGKSNVVRLLAALTGQQLKSIAVNSAMDTTEILGGFEQTDYNRHLEQLFERVATLLIDTLRTKITVNKLKQVAKLHEHLDRVRRSFDENVAGRTMAAETQLFLRKIQELSDLTSTLETWEPNLESELQDIQSRLRNLSVHVKRDKCLNAGGKFEWVDSVLVKCLQDGTWLLIDQVNLCSPAVLDRLNGLLEPNGVLSIGERGVDNDGNVVTIKPHENFRLFLTMDPRYGEISRAMRNRGVEIYMLGSREKVDHDAIDLKSLLFNAGITRPARRDALLAIHDKVSQEMVAVDRLSAVDLLHAAFLVRQRSLRGFPAEQSIRDACIDVYVKARPTIRDPRYREHLIALIDEIIEQVLSSRDEEISPIDVDAATWSVKNLQDNSALTLIRQQGLLLNTAVRMCRSRLTFGATNAEGVDIKSLNVFCDLQVDGETLNVDIRDILLHLLLNFYEQSSRDDTPLRKDWISKTLRENRSVDKLEEKNALMAEEIKSFRFRSANANTSLPWDQWWLVGKTVENENIGNDSSKLALLLYTSSVILGGHDATRTDVEKLKNGDVISVKQYSDIVRHGKLFSQLKNQPLITHFVEFLQRANSCIDAILRDGNMSVSPDVYVELRRHLRWYTRFERLGETMLVDKSKKSKNVFINLKQTSTLLRVHYKWLLKFLRKLCEMINEFTPCQKTVNEIESLIEMKNDLNHQLQSVYNPVQKISKRIKKYLTLPLPHPSEISMNVHSELGEITKDLEARDETGNTLKRELKIVSVQLNEGPAMRRQTISLWSDVHSLKAIDEETLETVLTVKRFCDDSHIRLRTPAEIESVRDQVSLLPAGEMTQLNARTQLWPIYEHMFLSLASSLQGKMCLEETIPAAIIEQCLARYADIASIPSDLMGLLTAMTRTEIEQRQSLLPLLFYQLAHFAQRSYAIQDSSLLLQWRGVTEEEDVESSLTAYSAPKMECYSGEPILLNLILRLILSKTVREKEKSVLSTVALGTYAAQTSQLQLLNEILWRNSISLTHNSARSDLITLKYYSRLYLSAIDRMNSEHNVASLIASVLEKQGENRGTSMEHTLRVDYFEPIEELHKAYDMINNLDEKNADEDEGTLRRGRTWMLLGYVQFLLFGNLDTIDPVHKVELKLKYLDEDIVDCERTMYVATLQSRVLGVNALAHPRLVSMRNCSEFLLKTRDEFSCLKTFRPPSVDFISLNRQCAHFRESVGTYKLVEKHMNKLCTIASEINENSHNSGVLAQADNALQEAQVWSFSIQRFAEQLKTKYLFAYPDVIHPLLTGLAQLRHGVCVLVNEIRRLVSSCRSGVLGLSSEIHNLIRFPTIGPCQESLLDLSIRCASRNMRLLIDRNSCSDAFIRMQEQFRILKSGLHELYNHAILSRSLTRSLWQNMDNLLRQIVLVWKQQQQEEEKRAAEKDSLYKNKIETYSSELTEEQELVLEIRQLFPTHRDSDFQDIDDESEPSLERRNPSPETEKIESLRGLIGKDDIWEIQRIHSDMVTSLVACKWKCNDITSISTSTNYVGPLIQRYDTVHSMLDNVLPALNEGLTIKLYNSLNLLVTLRLQTNQERSAERAKTYDFYKDCNIEEVKQCLPVCENILNRVDQLLQEWPAHPTLKSIQSIIERIYTFPIISAVSRFLTGLELLLVKMHQWEENAHSGVSMADHVSALAQQIISWRKLELSCWKGCLDATFNSLRSNTSKWWFFLYALIESYIREDVEGEASDEPITRKKLVESLERFMHESPLVEFEPRLQLLLTFHCHVYHLENSERKDELAAVLWNVYKYYKQFVGDVTARIAALKAPIEKKLRDFVKIARWNDISYWAVQKAVEKTHRTLHKFVKEFQNVLKQNVSSCLIVKSSSYNAEISKGIWDDQDHRKYLIDPIDFAAAKPSQLVEVRTLSVSNLIVKTETLQLKAIKLCKEIILTSSYPCARAEVENFIESFLERSARLRDMNIDRNSPKSKQKSQAKSILQQKRMTLANYFKTLTRIGVSYRTGMLTLKNNTDKVMDFTVSPLDLSVINQYFKLKNIDQHMLTQWRDCDKYYYKSLIRLNALNAMFNTSQTDLGPQNMERCRGCSAHIMLMTHRQKKIIAQSFDYFSSLRVSLSNLSETNEKDLSPTRQRAGRECATYLKALLVTLEAGFEQLLLFLQCCPANAESTTDACTAALTLNANALPIIAASQDDEVWKNANALLKNCLDSIKVTAIRFRALFLPLEMSTDDFECDARVVLFNSKHFEFLEQCRSLTEDLRTQCGELRRLFESTNVAHPILENVTFLDEKMECFARALREFDHLRKSTEFENEKQPVENDEAVRQYESALEHLINTTLLVIQKKYKDHTNFDDVTPTNEEPTRENEENDGDASEEEIEEGRLKETLVEGLKKDIVDLKLPKISELFAGLLSSIQELDPRSANHCIRLLLKCSPLLEQYILLVQFYLNEQVASFRVTCKLLYLQLNVFLDLATNGFCVPKDLDFEEGETDESGQKTDKGGLGLADGEGTKDVSDRIESEDQLEDARPADQDQEKEEDKTCKEEEKGIDMSEDFDSKLQDMEKGDDNEEQSDDDEENDLDKEMGETGEGAEHLDKEIWGDDKEEDDNQQKDEGEEGTGEQIGEKEIGAKDDKSRQNDNDNDMDREEDQREEEKKEINELNEPEIDEDQIDPYHGKHQPEPEPEPFDLPEDLNLDEDGKEDNGGEEEDPFDIDAMKDSKPPPEKMDVDLDEETEKNDKNDPSENASEGEDENDENVNKENQQQETEDLEADKEETGEDNKEGKESTNKDDEDEHGEEEAKEENLREKAAPSADDASKQIDAAQQIEETKEGSRDAVAQTPNNEDRQETSAENTQEEKDDTGTGQSQSTQQESGHSGSAKERTAPVSQRDEATKPAEKRKNPGESNEDRSLLDKFMPTPKKLRTIYTPDEISNNEKEDEPGDADGNKAEMCQHVKDSETFDDYTMDAATEDQVKQQASNTKEDEENREEQEDDAMDVEMHKEDEENVVDDKVTEQRSEKVSQATEDKRKKESDHGGNNVENNQMDTIIELEGDSVKTMTVQRGNESTFHTSVTNWEDNELSCHMEKKRFEVEKMLGEWKQKPTTEEAATAWNCLSSVTDTAARDLSEKLRLVLEPTQASRLKGDYKTGKRINMRKIIPYIASQFRKDKIWLRRTKPSKRDYQIVLALDDSKSMANNHAQEMAFESLSLICKAMTYLEVGQLGVVSFGEQVQVLHPLGETFTEQSGSRLIQDMRFDQRTTKFAEVVNFTVDMFESQHMSNNAKLLIILSDGMGIFSIGTEKVTRAVRRAKLANIFTVFIILDNPTNKHSILDIREPVFQGSKLLEFRSCMDDFPFPFYMIVRNIDTLPAVLSDALRQWFEVVGKIDT